MDSHSVRYWFILLVINRALFDSVAYDWKIISPFFKKNFIEILRGSWEWENALDDSSGTETTWDSFQRDYTSCARYIIKTIL